MIAFRHVDPRFPFLWEAGDQPPGRWHGTGEGPVHYLADTPDGAWAEYLRHEEIRDPTDLAGIRRSIWAVEIPAAPSHRPKVAKASLVGGLASYERCRREARRLRRQGAAGLTAPSAALLPGEAAGWRVDGGVRRADRRDGRVVVLFGRRPDLVGWEAVAEGRPGEQLLGRVRHLAAERISRGTASRSGRTGPTKPPR